MKTQISLIRVYTVCHSICMPGTQHGMAKSKYFIFKTIMEIAVEVPIFRILLYITRRDNTKSKRQKSGEPGLMYRVLALHAGSRGFNFNRGHMSERFFRSNISGYPHPVSSELENSGIRVPVGDCSVTERRRWRPPYQTGKTVHVHAKYYKHNEDGRTVPGVCGNGSVPLSHSGNVVTRIGLHSHI